MKKILIIVLAWVAGAFVPPAQGHPMPKKTAKAELYFAKRCGEQSVRAVKACIHRAAIHWGVSYSDGLYIADRESKFNPNICNSQGSGACGLFQFMPRTWCATPYCSRDRFSAKWNALAWAYGWSGRGGLGPSHWGM